MLANQRELIVILRIPQNDLLNPSVDGHFKNMLCLTNIKIPCRPHVMNHPLVALL